MLFLHPIAVLLLVLAGNPDFLRESGYFVARDGEEWVVRKPRAGGRPPLTISRHRDRQAAESRTGALPVLRLSAAFVHFDPVTNSRTVIGDWTAEEDAREISAGVGGILDLFAPPALRALLETTPLYMARLFGATGHTAEESADPTSFVIYLDPFRATGRLHAASTLVHELTHVERCRVRGFHANRAAAVLSKKDFVLLGLADELAAYEAEANLVRRFLDAQADRDVRRAAAAGMCNRELQWPRAVTVLLGFEGPPGEAGRMVEARRQVTLDLKSIAARYWEARHKDPLDASLRQRIRRWYKGSKEWKAIASQASDWRKAGLRE